MDEANGAAALSGEDHKPDEEFDVLQYQGQLEIIAKWLCKGNRENAEVFEDLIQEMYVALLEAGPGHTTSWYLTLAKNRAINYLKSKRHNYSYENQEEHISVDALTGRKYDIGSSDGQAGFVFKIPDDGYNEDDMP